MKASLGLALVLLFAGCSSPTVRVNAKEAPTDRIGKYSTLQVIVRSAQPDSDEVIQQLRSIVIGKLSSRTLFSGFVTQDDPGAADLRMIAIITELKGVSGGSRVMLGALAGKAKLRVMVDLEDIRESRTISQFSVEGKSSGGSVAAGTTPEAVEMAAQGIADYLQQHR